jgi:cytochrome c biogenesis protein CcdA
MKKRKKYKDPVTGDNLTRSEWLSWNIQTYVIRTWWFLIGFTAVTLTCIYLGIATANTNYATNWNYLASYLAIFVEAIVGRAMFSQTRRDAVMIREIKKLMHEIKKVQQTDLQHQQEDLKVSRNVEDQLSDVLGILTANEVEGWYGEWNE